MSSSKNALMCVNENVIDCRTHVFGNAVIFGGIAAAFAAALATKIYIFPLSFDTEWGHALCRI